MNKEENKSTVSESGAFFQKGLDCLSSGQVVDYEQAFYWLSKSSEFGNEKAQVIIGEMYDAGLGIEQNSIKAQELLGKFHTDSGLLPSRQMTAIASELLHKPKWLADNKQQSPTSPAQDRCIACGQRVLIPATAHKSVFTCPSNRGGCGSDLYFPIAEEGLRMGLAIQSYHEYSVDGHPSAYSFLGSYVHIIKYSNRADDDIKQKMVEEIANRILECCVLEHLASRETIRHLLVVPAPSSVRRTFQHVLALATQISKECYGVSEVLRKSSNVEAKNRVAGSELGDKDITCHGDVLGKNILIIDDTYGEGATLRACIRALKNNGAANVYFLSLCKNNFGGMKVDV